MGTEVTKLTQPFQNFLICKVLINSGARTGVVSGMTTEEVETAELRVFKTGWQYYVI
jgi:hypothetical protein